MECNAIGEEEEDEEKEEEEEDDDDDDIGWKQDNDVHQRQT